MSKESSSGCGCFSIIIAIVLFYFCIDVIGRMSDGESLMRSTVKTLKEWVTDVKTAWNEE